MKLFVDRDDGGGGGVVGAAAAAVAAAFHHLFGALALYKNPTDMRKFFVKGHCMA